MCNETSKAWKRRLKEDSELQNEFWRNIFSGKGIDIGCGGDKLPLEGCDPFDIGQGDANKIDEYFTQDNFDYIHASQCLEHMKVPHDALERWMRIVKPGGYAVITIPDFDLYEKRVWPSKFNWDHKAVFSLWRKGYHNVSPFYHVPTMLKNYNVILCRLVSDNYDWNAPDNIDQTVHTQAECFIEFVIKK